MKPLSKKDVKKLGAIKKELLLRRRKDNPCIIEITHVYNVLERAYGKPCVELGLLQGAIERLRVELCQCDEDHCNTCKTIDKWLGGITK